MWRGSSKAFIGRGEEEEQTAVRGEGGAQLWPASRPRMASDRYWEGEEKHKGKWGGEASAPLSFEGVQ